MLAATQGFPVLTYYPRVRVGVDATSIPDIASHSNYYMLIVEQNGNEYLSHLQWVMNYQSLKPEMNTQTPGPMRQDRYSAPMVN